MSVVNNFYNVYKIINILAKLMLYGEILVNSERNKITLTQSQEDTHVICIITSLLTLYFQCSHNKLVRRHLLAILFIEKKEEI